MTQIKKILAGFILLAVLVSPATASAAITFDAATSAEPVTVVTPYTNNHTSAGSNRIAFVYLLTSAATAGVSVTYDSTSMTLLTATQSGTAYKIYVYYLVAPSTTAGATVSVAFTGQLIDFAVATYAGVSQNSDVVQDSAGHVEKGTASATSYSSQVDSSQTTSQNNSWQVGVAAVELTTVSAGSGTTLRANPGSAGTSAFVDNNAAITPAGTNTLNWTPTESQRGAWISWTVAPFVATPSSFFGSLVIFGDW